MKVTVRFRYRVRGGHTHIRVYGAMEGKTPSKCGDLIFRNEEWEEFRKLLDPSVQVVEEDRA
jgi:hypothetical protein